ncbi:GNAT family N-acetyltransferase [Candidatus Omnitrophota bacterium]
MKTTISDKVFQVQLGNAADILEKAQLLRGKVFLGQEVKDSDRFDAYCDHLVVTDDDTDQAVGTYRLLLGSVARNTSGFYSETEFDLSNIRKNCGAELLEMGRACVDERYRRYSIIGLLWKTILDYIEHKKVGFIFGCASIDEPTSEKVGRIFGFLKESYYSLPQHRVSPLQDKGFPFLKSGPPLSNRQAIGKLPSLVKGYLGAGALVCGEPAWDKTFNTADFFMLLDTAKTNSSYLKKIL